MVYATNEHSPMDGAPCSKGSAGFEVLRQNEKTRQQAGFCIAVTLS